MSLFTQPTPTLTDGLVQQCHNEIVTLHEELVASKHFDQKDNSTDYSKTNKPFITHTTIFCLTSAESMRLTAEGNGIAPSFSRGDFVHVMIHSSGDDEDCPVSGDFFFAVMSSTKQKKSTTGRIIDHTNGSYSVFFYAGWSGTADIAVTLVHPRAAVDWIENHYRTEERHVEWNAWYRNGTRTEESICYVSRALTFPNKCVYVNENALGRTAFVCDRPQHLSCEEIKTTKSRVTSLDASVNKSLSEDLDILFKKPYLMTAVVGSPIKISIQEENTDLQFDRPGDDLPRCGEDLPRPMSDGFWENDVTWTSRVCKARHWSTDEMRQCLKEKTLYILGDSTVRQIYELITKLFGQKLPSNPIERTWTETANRTTVTYQFHPILIGSRIIDFWRQKFESDTIDGITTTECNSVILLSLSYHFASWTKASYEERLLQVRQATVRLKSRCPDVIIIVKSSHPREHARKEGYIHSSDWTLYDMNNMMRAIFKGVGVKFLDVYDMSLSHFARNRVHMPLGSVIRQQIDLLMSYICPDFDNQNITQ
ncbi:NXPE family member 3-like [Ptychodera flava]|uniref:NXPE family member 3-like n=1 Tax=Ptychodera flava TaxID=63121 RepID=UPI00396A9990